MRCLISQINQHRCATNDFCSSATSVNLWIFQKSLLQQEPSSLQRSSHEDSASRIDLKPPAESLPTELESAEPMSCETTAELEESSPRCEILEVRYAESCLDCRNAVQSTYFLKKDA